MNTPQATCAEREDFAQALLIAADKIRAQRPPSEVTEDMDPHFPRAGGIMQSPANSPVPTSPQLPVVSLGGGAGAHTPASLSPLVEQCMTCKNVRDDEQCQWRPMEGWELVTIREAGIRITDGVCPGCAREYLQQLRAAK